MDNKNKEPKIKSKLCKYCGLYGSKCCHDTNAKCIYEYLSTRLITPKQDYPQQKCEVSE